MPPTILIVEDEALVALATEQLLEQAGFEVVGSVASGLAAIEACKRHHPDVVVMDINLQGAMDGCETAVALKQYCGAGIVYVTGQGDTATRNRAMATAPADYLVKPFSPDRLSSAIEAALHRSDRQLR